MNKELNDLAKSRLYGLTSIVCSIWLVQSIYETIQQKQEIFTVLNIIFYLSIIIVIVYTAFSAYEMKQKLRNSGKLQTKN